LDAERALIMRLPAATILAWPRARPLGGGAGKGMTVIDIA
jgi:hypothetical protein